MKDNSTRYRHFFLVLYCSSIDIDKILIKNSEKINHCCYICHDKDIYDDDLIDNDGNYVHRKGEVVKVHYHMLISFYNGHTFSAVKRLFSTDLDKPRVEKCIDILSSYRYLIHLDHPNKYQYSSADIIHAVDEKFYTELDIYGDKNDKDNIAMAIVKDLLKKTNPMIMLHRYGRDYLIHKRQYDDFVADYRVWTSDHPETINSKELDDELVQMGLLD